MRMERPSAGFGPPRAAKDTRLGTAHAWPTVGTPSSSYKRRPERPDERQLSRTEGGLVEGGLWQGGVRPSPP